MTDALLDAIDEAGRDLLKRCSAVDAEGKTVPIGQQIEAITALAKWAEIRHKISPPAPTEEKKENRFDRIKSEFHGRRKRPPADRETASLGVASDTTTETVSAANGAGSASDAVARDGVAESEPVSH